MVFSSIHFHGRTNRHVSARSSRHCAFDKQQIPFSIHANDFKILGGHLFIAHVTGHLFTFEYPARRLILAN
jgi:hypothetical protein